jgi:hypothetical protein
VFGCIGARASVFRAAVIQGVDCRCVSRFCPSGSWIFGWVALCKPCDTLPLEIGGLRGGKAGIFRKIRATPPDGHLVFEEAGRVGFLGNRL